MKVATLLLFTLSVYSTTAQFRKSREKEEQKPTSLSQNILNYANPTEYYIGGIDIVGLKVLDKNAMISLTNLRVGDKIKIPGDQIALAIKKLWKHGLVGDAKILIDRIEGETVYLIIELTERPRLNDYYFTGISKGRQSSLKEELNIIKGKIVNDATLRNTELAVKKFYHNKGFLNTEVKIFQEVDTISRGGIRLRIDVDIKSKVKIHSITFDGNVYLTDSKLKGKMKKTNENSRFSVHRELIRALLTTSPRKYKSVLDSSHHVTWRQLKSFVNENVKLNFLKSSKFIQSEFEDDKNNVITYMNTKGYRDAEILKDSISQYSANSINIDLSVFEGKKYYYRNIIWEGNYIHSSSTLNKILGIKKGDVYNKELLDKKTTFDPKGADITGLYQDDGYLFFHVQPIEIAVVGDSIDIEMRLYEGEQATLDKVIISGNDRTSDHVIRRELSTVPGQKFRRSDIIRTSQMLSSMGYFNPQKIQPDVRPNQEKGTVDIEWVLEEQSNDQIQLSGGWGGYYGFVGTVGLTFNNFSAKNLTNLRKWRPLPVGDGQRLSLQVQANGKSFQSYSISFTEPWLGGKKPNSFNVSVTHSISRRPNNNFQFTNDQTLKQIGVNFSLGKRLEWPDNYFTFTNSIGYLLYSYSNYLYGPTSLPPVGRTNSIMLNTRLARNSMDNMMYPTSGSSIELSASLTPPYSLFKDPSFTSNVDERFKWLELHKWMFDAKFYLKILGSSKPEGRSLVLETRAHMGFIGTYNKKLTVGPFERFFLGGAGLSGGFNTFVLGQEIVGLRGYPDNHVTPPLYDKYGAASASTIEGGIVYNKYVMELRYPVTLGQTATIYALIFGEAGNNWNNFNEFNPFDNYKSAGFGARIFMPAFGLIGLNWAYGFDTLPNASTKSGSQFHFTIGQQIR